MTLLPGSTIGSVLGGGQPWAYVYRCGSHLIIVIVLEPDPHSPAAQLADEHTIAAYDDEHALRSFGGKCDVVTTEFENIPARTLEFLTQFCPVRPRLKR